ncbi:MAG: hypothetical protein PHE84_10155 [bacterium]|nr:hypothetical protein [bacterium]
MDKRIEKTGKSMGICLVFGALLLALCALPVACGGGGDDSSVEPPSNEFEPPASGESTLDDAGKLVVEDLIRNLLSQWKSYWSLESVADLNPGELCGEFEILGQWCGNVQRCWKNTGDQNEGTYTLYKKGDCDKGAALIRKYGLSVQYSDIDLQFSVLDRFAYFDIEWYDIDNVQIRVSCDVDLAGNITGMVSEKINGEDVGTGVVGGITITQYFVEYEENPGGLTPIVDWYPFGEF